jgi:hypothetical protein
MAEQDGLMGMDVWEGYSTWFAAQYPIFQLAIDGDCTVILLIVYTR